MKKITVVAAIIFEVDKYLCLQRNFSKYPYISYKYEFPGGKIESGETMVDALKREIMEELTLDIEVIEEYLKVEHKYPDFEIIMHSFLCKKLTDNLILKEHINFVWLNKSELAKLDWAEADIPIVNKLMR
jgi:8-oxo-dGTP diphosphatase